MYVYNSIANMFHHNYNSHSLPIVLTLCFRSKNTKKTAICGFLLRENKKTSQLFSIFKNMRTFAHTL